ncbi:outer membrane protein assembly factor BamB family protein [Glycomyces salinus]|uniref:outer membrane protein assembly factor BamB family protein n=1 Tax=Glycomyces salinus TaxID=980294 RepID=UPI0018EA8D54|nr:PQQ-binding-like beta-propeller repeat protein [Glycomyces salinus]
MSASASNPETTRPVGRPLARVFLRTAGLTALFTWAALLVWAAFGSASVGSSGVYMIIGTVASVLIVAVCATTAAAHPGLRTIAAALFAAVFAACAGWLVYSSMPEAGPDDFITHRAGVAALAYAFGVIGGGLLALGEFAVEGYSGGRRRVPGRMSTKVGVLAAAIVIMAAAALAPAMQRWAELANQDVRTGDVDQAAAAEKGAGLGSVERFVETPYGLLRIDHPGETTPQAVTLLDPASGDAIWYHRRWNWKSSQAPILSHQAHLVALTGPRADDPGDFQARVLAARTGAEVATVGFGDAPGVLLAVDDDRLLYAGERSEVFTAYDFDGEVVWEQTLPAGCHGEATQISSGRVVMLADCVPAPDRMIARDWIIAFDAASGEQVWEREIDRESVLLPESFLVTEDSLVIDSRKELRVTDGPFSARRFEHRLLSFALEDGSLRWRNADQVFGSTNSSACGGVLRLSQPVALAEASDAAGTAGEGDGARPAAPTSERRTVQLVECYTSREHTGSWFGVMAYDLDSGEKLYRKSVKLGFTPLDRAVAGGWSTVLPDNRAILATDLSLDRTKPDCRLYEIAEGEAERIDLADGDLPAAWCHEAQLTTVADGAAISYVTGEDTRGIFLLD